MFKSKVISCPGTYHIRNGMPTEDHYSLRQSDDISVAVLCDGAGSAQHGSAAAQIISGLLSRYIYENFDMIFGELPDVVLRKAAQMIDGSLTAHSQRKAIDAREMASTVMAVAMDTGGRCICFHLGDGIILRKTGENPELEIVSSPQNGILENTTYLTMNCSTAERMKFYRWCDEEVSELVLMTDGAYSCAFENVNGIRRAVMNDASVIKCVSGRRKNAEDDCSCIVIERIK